MKNILNKTKRLNTFCILITKDMKICFVVRKVFTEYDEHSKELFIEPKDLGFSKIFFENTGRLLKEGILSAINDKVIPKEVIPFDKPDNKLRNNPSNVLLKYGLMDLGSK